MFQQFVFLHQMRCLQEYKRFFNLHCDSDSDIHTWFARRLTRSITNRTLGKAYFNEKTNLTLIKKQM